MLYSSLDASSSNIINDLPADANSYRPFKVVNTIVTNNIQKELDLLEGLTEERALIEGDPIICYINGLAAPVALVGALTKALCCKLLNLSPSVWLQ